MLVTAFLINFCPKYVEYDFTAGLENELDEVAAGKLGWKDLLHSFWGDFKNTVDHASGYKITDVIARLEDLLGSHLFPEKSDGADSRQCLSCKTGKLSLKLGKFGAFIACSNYPECKFTKQISQDTNEASDIERGPDENTKLLGKDDNANDIYLKKGPYGFYVQVGDGGDKTTKPKRVSVPSSIALQDVDLSKALRLLSLPLNIGNHPETNEEMMIGVGKFGPYIKYAGKFVSIPKNEDFLSISVSKAVEILAKKAKKTK